MIASPGYEPRHQRRGRRPDLWALVLTVALLLIPTFVLLALLIREELRP